MPEECPVFIQPGVACEAAGRNGARNLEAGSQPPFQSASLAEGTTPSQPDRLRLGLPADARVVLCVGSLKAERGFRDAIWAFDILQYLAPNLHLALLGTGPDEHRLRHFARSVGVLSSVHLTGSVGDTSAWLAAAEIVWVPSREGGGAQVALRAMAAARPVVASRLGALTEIVADGETGYLITPGDKVALARQTRRLLDDASLRTRMGAAGALRAQRYFSAEALVDRFARLYESMRHRPLAASGSER
jgi:glycosyltransferase involved in cell wall biosynthesis